MYITFISIMLVLWKNFNILEYHHIYNIYLFFNNNNIIKLLIIYYYI